MQRVLSDTLYADKQHAIRDGVWGHSTLLRWNEVRRQRFKGAHIKENARCGRYKRSKSTERNEKSTQMSKRQFDGGGNANPCPILLKCKPAGAMVDHIWFFDRIESVHARVGLTELGVGCSAGSDLINRAA